MQTIWARTVLTPQGWQQGALIEIGDDGVITGVSPNAKPGSAPRFGTVVPAPVNLHSHGFQRAMAGLTEARGAQAADSFWTWRQLMYRFLDHLTPDDVHAITAFAQMEMLQAGFGSVCEFHYLHHQIDGAAYDNPAEMADSIVAAAQDTEIGLTMLPVLYQVGGCDGRALGDGQRRFGSSIDRFAKLIDGTATALSSLPPDANLGIAPHSLRAVSPEGLGHAADLLPDAPFHIHVAEQTAEVKEVSAARGARPVQWLLGEHDVNDRWCLIHATQMTADETSALAKTGATAGLCPETEASLGDGIFDGVRYLGAGGQFGLGTDSNIRISLAGEMRGLEYSQRLRDHGRALFATADKSTGRCLWENISAGGARAAGRLTGSIQPGQLADMLALDLHHPNLTGRSGDTALDTFVFAESQRMITDVWSAGRHVVKDGAHVRQGRITARYIETITALMARI